MKIDLGCGRNKKPGYIGIDSCKEVKPDIVCKLGIEKLPFEDNSVTHVYSNHFIEHLYDHEIEYLLYELYRVCKNGAIIKIRCPHQMSPVAAQIGHKHMISENTFDAYRYKESEGISGQSHSYFEIDYEMEYMTYKPKRSGILRLLPFISIVPCNIYFKLKVIKTRKIRKV